MEPLIGYRAVGFIFLVAVLVVGSVGTILQVLLAATLSAVGWNFFFIPPKLTFTIAAADDIILCIVYFVAAIITGILTHRIRVREQVIRQHEKQLREAERLEESEKIHQTLLNSISHEMRTPLTAIIGAASALADEQAPDTKEFRRVVAKELSTASDRLNRVIENLLDMSRLNAGAMTLKREWHDVSDVIGVVMRRLGRNVEKHRVKIVAASDLPLIELDFRLSEHALANVVLNAIQYSPEGSEIVIGVTKKGAEVHVTVEDNGPGISRDQLSRVFEKFYRVPGTPAGGTGLGLSIAKSIIELHRGRIWAEPRAGGGTRFSIVFPVEATPLVPKEQDAKSLSH